MPIDMTGVTFSYDDRPRNTVVFPGMKARYFVTVLNRFVHAFTKDVMYEIRTEWCDLFGGNYPCAERSFITEHELRSLWENRIEK